MKGHPKLRKCVLFVTSEKMVYNFLTINVTDTNQDVVTYYTITDLSPLMIFNFTVYITSSLHKIKNQDYNIFCKLIKRL